ncbi:MAG: hypothetical protein LBV42_03875 [Methanobrevibacter sp.]|jgi:hypothetical protein|nr:hypothetical protein [Methanobrevibacter sp.]
MVEDLVEKLKNKALEYKDDLKREEIPLKIGESIHNFRLAGIGGKAIKLEKYVKYDEIVEAIGNGKDSLEKDLKSIIDKFGKNDDE